MLRDNYKKKKSAFVKKCTHIYFNCLYICQGMSILFLLYSGYFLQSSVENSLSLNGKFIGNNETQYLIYPHSNHERINYKGI